jgi:Skp family chaperone for outer membrane proteins
MESPMNDRLSKILVTAIAVAAFVAPAAAEDYRIGVLHVERILQQSAAAKAAHDRIEQEF